jgi:hypothetical protein
MTLTYEAKFNWADEVIEAASQAEDLLLLDQLIEQSKPSLPPRSLARDLIPSKIHISINYCSSNMDKFESLLTSQERKMDSDNCQGTISGATALDNLDTTEISSNMISGSTDSSSDTLMDSYDVGNLESDSNAEKHLEPFSFSSTDTEGAECLEDEMIKHLEEFDSDCRSPGNEEEHNDMGVFHFEGDEEKENEKPIDEGAKNNLQVLAQAAQDLGHMYESPKGEGSSGMQNEGRISRVQNRPDDRERSYEEEDGYASSEEEWFDTVSELEAKDTANSSLPSSLRPTTLIIQPEPQRQAPAPLQPDLVIVTWIDIFFAQDDFASQRSRSWLRKGRPYKRTPAEHVQSLATRGVKVTDYGPTRGEVRILNDSKLLRWRCPPSKLRHAWTYM